METVALLEYGAGVVFYFRTYLIHNIVVQADERVRGLQHGGEFVEVEL